MTLTATDTAATAAAAAARAANPNLYPVATARPAFYWIGAGSGAGETTAITETKDRLYVQSLHAKGLGWKAR